MPVGAAAVGAAGAGGAGAAGAAGAGGAGAGAAGAGTASGGAGASGGAAAATGSSSGMMGGGMKTPAGAQSIKTPGVVNSSKAYASKLPANMLQLGVGGVQSIVGLAQRNRANQIRPSETDPMRTLAMTDYKRKAKNAFTGSSLQSNLRDIMQGRAGNYKALARTTGPGALRNMAYQSRLQGQNMNKLLGQAQQQEQFYEKMFQKEMMDIEERRYATQQQKFGEMKSRAEKNIQVGQENALAAGSKLLTLPV